MHVRASLPQTPKLLAVEKDAKPVDHALIDDLKREVFLAVRGVGERALGYIGTLAQCSNSQVVVSVHEQHWHAGVAHAAPAKCRIRHMHGLGFGH